MRVSSSFIGRSRFISAPFTTLEAFTGYTLSSAYWRQGYGTEAAQAMIQCVFQELKLERLAAEIEQDNIASIRLMQKVGMEIRNAPYSDWRQIGLLKNTVQG